MNEILCLIITEKDNINKANLLYSIIRSKWKNSPIYISYVDNNIEFYKIDKDKYIIINETINHYSVITDLKHNIKGVITIPDNLLPNFNHLNDKLNEITSDTDFICQDGLIEHSLFIYMSIKTIKILTENLRCNIVDILIENKIKIDRYNLYSYNFNDIDKISVINLNYKIKNLFVLVFAGLGNQLFQVSAGYSMAKKNNMFLILLYTNNHYDYGHSGIFEFTDTIFKDFIYIPEINKSGCDCVEINIENTSTDYIPDIIISGRNNFIKGYYQNEKYLTDYKQDIIELFISNDIYKNIFNKYSNLVNSYFIHYRRGDYVGHQWLTINYDKYFKLSIEYILENDKDAHFYILSNDIGYCKNYNVFRDIKKTFIENLNTLETLYFMSLCKGGICSNSSFSWWGSYLNTNLNTNLNKITIFPSIWFNQKKDENIYRDDCIVIDASL